MSFPSVRMRRLRRTPAIRELMSHVKVNPSDLIYPLFVEEDIRAPVPINSMPGCSRWPISQLKDEVTRAMVQDVKAVMLFGIPSRKDEVGSGAY